MKKERRCLGRRIEGVLFILFFLWISTAFSQSNLKIPLYIHHREIWVEVAQTPEERAHGLMGRRHLGKDEGMFFIFEIEGFHGFWMKGTLLPLSIAFVDKEGRIVWVTDMEPLSLESHLPPKPILYALEMNKGWFTKNSINVGDVIRFSK
jgi:uncharacterized membrane protein (UPF0127 family)